MRKIICKTTYPEIEVAGLGKFKNGDILTEEKAPANVLDQLLLGGEWEKAKRDEVAEATVIDGVDVPAEEPKPLHKKSKVSGG